MTSLFYQKSWNIIKSDLVTWVNKFLIGGSRDRRVNMTHICLIPKSGRPTKMTEFRPISLCNVGYKIISKLLYQRLKKVLPSLISETQSAFVPVRLISDNILIAQEMFHGLMTNNSCKSKFMAIKTDMSKAYDRVEWSFLEELLRKFGFAEKWVEWMMWCIKSVKYRVLINGKPHGIIAPNRGLRQGDPLSPYLFILCTEALIANFKKAERTKLITGLKVARQCPPISHLLFADDSLFFCKANIAEATAVLNILKKYEKVSGQKINYDKSSLQFGHKVLDTVQADMKRILGITQLGGMGSYLGIPESLGGAKIKIFSFIRERLQDRINGWTSKFISKGGKEVLIKSVATALPTYVMSCFRLPKAVTSKLTSAIANFWWSSNGQQQGLHWWSWDKMCRPKAQGGIGFRIIDDFNTALLAKQLWRLIDSPDSLFARVFKSRYYRNGTPLDLFRCYSPSYGWRSIISARPLVNKGLIKCVGSGNSISVWEDPWIPDISPRPATCSGHSCPPLTVNLLIDPVTRSWNVNLLNAIISPKDVDIIKSIPISQSFSNDLMTWHYTKTGKYTVKTGYEIVRERFSNNDESLHYGPTIEPLLEYGWNLKCPPKLRHFIWQLLAGNISVNGNLRKRGLNCDIHCVRCGAEIETVNHVFFECPPSVQTWALSNIPSALGIFPVSSVFANLDYLFNRNPTREQSMAFPWILWYIWKSRNDKVFNNKEFDTQELLLVAERESHLWISAQEEELLEDQESSSTPIRSVSLFHGDRCFIDGSWKQGENFSGLGWYCQLHGGISTIFGARKVRRSLTPLHAEMESLIWAIQCMLEQQKTAMLFLTDSTDLVKIVNNPEEWRAFHTYTEELKAYKGSFSFFSVIHTSRSFNTDADKLARDARLSPNDLCYVKSTARFGSPN